MGCDGGTIPKRDELVRTKKKAEQKDKQSELNFRWRCCSISQTPLKEPIVACGLGRLYNKDAVITGILEKSFPESAKHIKSIKDVKELSLTKNPAFSYEEGKSDSYIDHHTAPYICPLIGLEMNGKFKFCFPWNCGCVVSERTMKELKSQLCHKCQQPVEESSVVILNAVENDLDLMKTRVEARQARLKAEKRAKKAANGVAPASLSSAPKSEDPEKEEQQQTSSTSSANPEKLKNGIKRSAITVGLQIRETKKTKPDYKIANDPEASDVYKSLFTSSNKAKNQTKAHWITYNPFYN